MIELYSIRDVARILGVQESRLRYWMQTGFVGPTVRKGGRFYYTFCDLLAVKAAKDLLDTGMPLQRVRKNVAEVREIRYTRKGIGSSYLFRVDDETVGTKHVHLWVTCVLSGDRLYEARQLRALYQPLVQAELLREDPLRRGP